MVDFNKYRCRNCKHWHNQGNLLLAAEGKCGKFIENTDPIVSNRCAVYCACKNFESNDNLVYLENLSE